MPWMVLSACGGYMHANKHSFERNCPRGIKAPVDCKPVPSNWQTDYYGWDWGRELSTNGGWGGLAFGLAVGLSMTMCK